jgi:glycosyltransferase involved in cell wall biosynthesis
VLLEYELADLLLVQSSFAAETFLAAGIPEERLVYVARGADLDRFTPADEPPPVFRAIFAGALIKRKGVHHILRAWHALALNDAELWLVGAIHPEIEPALREFSLPSVKVPGFSRDLPALFRASSVFLFPSECEGWAKVTFEAAAAGLPMIGTRESGDGVIDGVTGWLVPANDPNALAEKIRHAHAHPELLFSMGRAARRRIAERFTWAHFRLRLQHAWARARSLR